MGTLVPLAQASRACCGGKADGLRRLLRAGLSVPEGVCLPVEVYRRALPATLPRQGTDAAALEREGRAVCAVLEQWEPDAALLAELAGLCGQGALVVRSSASNEDLGAGAPGLYDTVDGARDVEGLVRAIRRCWCSLWSITSGLVLRRQGRWPGSEAMGVVIQRQLHPRCSGLALSAVDGVLVEAVSGAGEPLASGAVDPIGLRLPRRGPPAGPLPAWLPLATLEAVRDAVLEVESLWGGAVEVEWALTDALWLLQARRCTAATVDDGWSAAGGPQVRWRWDREHNPEPLSPAHASLVRLLDPRGERLQVIRGYLFEAEGGGEGAAGARLEQVWQRFEQLEGARLARLEQRQGEGSPAQELRQAVDRFVELADAYFGELASARRDARLGLVALLRGQGVARPVDRAALLCGAADNETLRRTRQLQQLAQQVREDPEQRRAVELADAGIEGWPASLRRAMAAHLARHGTLFPVWDVAVPTLAERPGQLLLRLRALLQHDSVPDRAGVVERARDLERDLMARLDPARRQEAARLLDAARLARRLEEDDDHLFSRALALVRRGLLRVGRLYREQGVVGGVEQIFLHTIPEVQDSLTAGKGLPAEAAERRARRWEEQRALEPPATIQGSSAWPAPRRGDALRGIGIGGVARGPVRLVRRMEQLLQQDLRGAVVVCATLLPALAVVLPEVAALVTDHGGQLSHAASLARELGVVAVVGTGRATRTLREGEPVWVDGRRGLVVRQGA